MENFTGMLPPYTPLRKLLYRLSQLALTESFIHWRSYLKKKQKTRPVIANTDNDDDDE